MTAVAGDEVAEGVAKFNKSWWLWLVTGILWLIIAVVVLSFDPTSAETIAFMFGFVLLFAGVAEFVAIGFVDGWKWLHAALGVLFLAAGVMALMEPFQTFGVLALLVGWFLLFKGIFDITLSIAGHKELPMWGLQLTVGIIEILLGLWAIGDPGRSAWLLILWVGLGALVRGFADFITAFRIRSLGEGS
ncbi:MAG: HdeD family acid-resistance protein [Microthrixaceae bacterium]